MRRRITLPLAFIPWSSTSFDLHTYELDLLLTRVDIRVRNLRGSETLKRAGPIGNGNSSIQMPNGSKVTGGRTMREARRSGWAALSEVDSHGSACPNEL
jgi:hypothetical protein